MPQFVRGIIQAALGVQPQWLTSMAADSRYALSASALILTHRAKQICRGTARLATRRSEQAIRVAVHATHVIAAMLPQHAQTQPNGAVLLPMHLLD